MTRERRDVASIVGAPDLGIISIGVHGYRLVTTNLDSAVMTTADNAHLVRRDRPDTANMAEMGAHTSTRLDIPDLDGVIEATRD